MTQPSRAPGLWSAALINSYQRGMYCPSQKSMMEF
jgi:hypothetical protein